jgi:hypothetical protein
MLGSAALGAKHSPGFSNALLSPFLGLHKTFHGEREAVVRGSTYPRMQNAAEQLQIRRACPSMTVEKGSKYPEYVGTDGQEIEAGSGQDADQYTAEQPRHEPPEGMIFPRIAGGVGECGELMKDQCLAVYPHATRTGWIDLDMACHHQTPHLEKHDLRLSYPVRMLTSSQDARCDAGKDTRVALSKSSTRRERLP